VKKIRKARNESWILNCLSNGSEIDRPETIEAYQHLDEAWIKLDCATEELFQSLNRPITSVGTIQDHLERLKKIPSLCLQTLVWKCSRNPSAANWTPANRKALISAYRKLAPKAIHLTTISREPAAIALEPVNVEELADFAREVRKLGLQIDVFP
jgi:wyosine [tRNA(Phe)-imidazoG37] synthetase (radical SAM superfamily)